MLTTSRTVSQDGLLPPVIVMWTPNLLMLSAGGYLLSLAARERRIVWLDNLFYRLDDAFTRVLARKNR